MFSRHWLSVSNFQWDAVSRPNNWLSLVFGVLLLLLTIMVVVHRRRMLLLVRALFSQRHFSLIQREGNLIEDRVSVVALLFDLLTITTGIVMFVTTYIPRALARLPFIASIGVVFVTLLAFYLLKLSANELYSVLFGRKKERIAMNQYKFITITDFAILLYPMLVAIHYAHLRFLFYVVAALLGVLIFVWLYRVMKINSSGGSGFHFFLYFCTLEFLPWLVMLKVLLII